MSLSLGFEFNQGNLQDYVDCPRRFQLKYLEKQPWPAIPLEPALAHEMRSELGQQFHRLVQRYYLGVPPEVLERSIGDGVLRRWWQAFLQEPPLNLPQDLRMTEVRLSVPVADQWLVAVFDLLAIDPDRRFVIVDWKTGGRFSRDIFARRLQSIVYPFVAVSGGAGLFGGQVDPARVMMVYWFAESPAEPHVFHYSEDVFLEAGQYLSSLIHEILERRVWSLCEDERLCSFCVYRSLCGRGDLPAVLSEEFVIDEFELFSLLDVAELEF